ncbi:MAG: helix-turn-helix transcriptional regulator [Gammaproteobacteria bacterium]|nr:helix-turn-helix transcriptional regulator [Gammaproteobacteria bacterium]
MTIQAHYWIQGLDMSLFAERLRLLRQARNITQARLAELLEVSPRVYNRWKKGGNVPHFDTIVKIADILQVALDELAGRQEPSQDLKIRNFQLHQLCQQCDTLPDSDQQALIVMMDSLVKKSDVTRVISKMAHG